MDRIVKRIFDRQRQTNLTRTSRILAAFVDDLLHDVDELDLRAIYGLRILLLSLESQRPWKQPVKRSTYISHERQV